MRKCKSYFHLWRNKNNFLVITIEKIKMIRPASSESVVERRKKIEMVGFFEKYGVLLFLVALIVIFTLYNPMF